MISAVQEFHLQYNGIGFPQTVNWQMANKIQFKKNVTNLDLIGSPKNELEDPGTQTILKAGGLRAPAAELHDLPVRFLLLIMPHATLCLHHVGRHARGRRELGRGLGVGPGDVGLGVLVEGPEGVVPSAEAQLVLEGLDRRYAGRHRPRLRRWCR